MTFKNTRNETLRKAVDVLDSEDGVSEDCYAFILSVLADREAAILADKVKATDGQFYLFEEDAAEIRNEYGFFKNEGE